MHHCLWIMSTKHEADFYQVDSAIHVPGPRGIMRLE